MRAFIAGLCCVVLAAQTAPDTADKLTVDGDVATPLTLTTADLARMPRETATLDEMDGLKTAYEGVARKEMRGKALAGYLLAEARDGYQVVFSLGELDPGVGGARVIVADQRDGKPMPAQQGPIRPVERLHVVQLRK
jgi:hypothetical protein